MHLIDGVDVSMELQRRPHTQGLRFLQSRVIASGPRKTRSQFPRRLTDECQCECAGECEDECEGWGECEGECECEG